MSKYTLTIFKDQFLFHSLLGLIVQVRVDVSSRLQGQVRASYVEIRRSIPDSLVLEPLREEYYYEASSFTLYP